MLKKQNEEELLMIGISLGNEKVNFREQIWRDHQIFCFFAFSFNELKHEK